MNFVILWPNWHSFLRSELNGMEKGIDQQAEYASGV